MGEDYRTINSTGVIILDGAAWKKYKKSSQNIQSEKRTQISEMSFDVKRFNKKNKSRGVKLRPEGDLFELEGDFVPPIFVYASRLTGFGGNSGISINQTLDAKVHYEKNCRGCGASESMYEVQSDANKRMIQKVHQCIYCGLKMYL